MFKKIWSYITFQKQPEMEGDQKYLRMMHNINRISILMFLIGIVVVVLKAFKKI